MARTGGFSFFERNEAAYAYGVRVIETSNQDAANYLIGTNRAFRWKSDGSSEGSSVNITVTFPESVTINRLFLIQHNFKSFVVQYDSAEDFSNVTGLDGALIGGISETDFSRNSAYYEFDAVSVSSLTITVDYTQAAEAEKTLAAIIATTEIGTLKGYPDIKGLTFDRNETSQSNAAGGQNIIKKRKTAKLKIDMNHYPYQVDIDLIAGLFDREDSFLVWPNGGKPDQFRLNIQGYRLEDIFLMQTKGTFKAGYYKNIYVLSAEQSVNMVEVDS